MAMSVLHTSQPRLSYQAMSPIKADNADPNDLFILTDPNFKINGSISSISSGTKEENERESHKKSKLLPNVMEKSLLKRLNIGMRSKTAWSSGDSRSRTLHLGSSETRQGGVTSVVSRSSGNGDNHYFHLPSLQHSRQFMLSRDSTRPQSRKDGFQAIEDQAGTRKSLLAKKIEEAIDSANKVKAMIREDRESGVTTAYGSKTIKGLKFIEEDRNIVKALRKSRQLKLAQQLANGEAGEKECPRLEEKKKHRTDRAGDKIPGNFKFPKESDFIPIATDKKRIDPIRVDWNVGGGMCPDRGSTSKLTGKLSKSCNNPVTDALHKEGTSVTRKQGKVLRQGDFQVSKVWLRPSNDISVAMLPAQMAREDIKNVVGSRILKSSQIKPLSNHSSAPKSERVERASDADVFSMSGRLTEIMEVSEEEE